MSTKKKSSKPSVVVLEAPPVREEDKIVLEVTATVPQFQKFIDENYGDVGSVYAVIDKAIEQYLPDDDEADL